MLPVDVSDIKILTDGVGVRVPFCADEARSVHVSEHSISPLPNQFPK